MNTKSAIIIFLCFTYIQAAKNFLYRSQAPLIFLEDMDEVQIQEHTSVLSYIDQQGEATPIISRTFQDQPVDIDDDEQPLMYNPLDIADYLIPDYDENTESQPIPPSTVQQQEKVKSVSLAKGKATIKQNLTASEITKTIEQDLFEPEPSQQQIDDDSVDEEELEYLENKFLTPVSYNDVQYFIAAETGIAPQQEYAAEDKDMILFDSFDVVEEIKDNDGRVIGYAYENSEEEDAYSTILEDVGGRVMQRVTAKYALNQAIAQSNQNIQRQKQIPPIARQSYLNQICFPIEIFISLIYSWEGLYQIPSNKPVLFNKMSQTDVYSQEKPPPDSPERILLTPTFDRTRQRVPESPFFSYCVNSLTPIPNQTASPAQQFINRARTPILPDLSASPFTEDPYKQIPITRTKRHIKKLDFANIPTQFQVSTLRVRVNLQYTPTTPTPPQTPITLPQKRPPTDSLKTGQCNCQRSKCLKLYCDCFREKSYCQDCNCVGCNNTPEYEEVRQEVIRQTLERNPEAFQPKINKVVVNQEAVFKHQTGCNCKKSACLKKYCECFRGGISCSEVCKCIGCKNHQDKNRRKKVQLLQQL